MTSWVREDDKGVQLRIRVVPRARQNRVDGLYGGMVKIRLTAPPVEGAANEALVKFLSKVLGVSRRDVEIVHGEHSREKVVAVFGVDAEQVRKALGIK